MKAVVYGQTLINLLLGRIRERIIGDIVYGIPKIRSSYNRGLCKKIGVDFRGKDAYDAVEQARRMIS